MPDQRSTPHRFSIAVAPNGGRKTKADHPHLPLSPAELAATAAQCAEAGAAMIHIHIRDEHDRHLLDAARYRQTIAAITDAVGDQLVIQITTEALGLYQPAVQMDLVRELQPEAVSLALRELVPTKADEKEFATFLLWLKSTPTLPQIILYSPEDARHLQALITRGIVPWADLPVLYVLGRYTAGQTSQPADLLPFLAPDQPDFAHWTVCAFGQNEAACVTTAGLLGGHGRVGFENNLFLPDGATAPTNADLVRTVADLATGAGKTLGTAQDLRRDWQNCLV